MRALYLQCVIRMQLQTSDESFVREFRSATSIPRMLRRIARSPPAAAGNAAEYSIAEVRSRCPIMELKGGVHFPLFDILVPVMSGRFNPMLCPGQGSRCVRASNCLDLGLHCSSICFQ